MHRLPSRLLLPTTLVVLLGLFVAGGRGAKADPQAPSPQPPTANSGPQPSPPLPAPTNIQQSWDGTKGAMTISFDPLAQPPSGTQLWTLFEVCTDVSAASICDQQNRGGGLTSGDSPYPFAEATYVAFSSSNDPNYATDGATSDPAEKATHYTMTGMNSTDYYVWQLCAMYKAGSSPLTNACSPNIVLNNGLHMPEYGDCTNCPGFWTTPGPNGCNHEDLLNYYVWRWAYPGDKVCVDPSRLTQVLADNAQADARRSPTGGAYGPNTCISGYVWRVAKPDDLVCVTPAERDRIAAENANPNPSHQ